MKKLALLFFTVLALALFAACGAPVAPDVDNNVGDGADDALTLSFEAMTLGGDTMSDAVFADYRLTMVNIWATFCSPCIEEMPELQELYGQLPEGVNMITICVDGESETELAQEIYDSIDGTFAVVLADTDLLKGFLTRISGVPTTVFVDSQGRVIGDFQLGAPGVSGKGTLAGKYLELINDRLLQVE
ncbi:MAG: TlpA family protein disulfide reductase [Clostridia bacterium]|nr:TlpA family protein disulfide reductase [Clostridia bacterium]